MFLTAACSENQPVSKNDPESIARQTVAEFLSITLDQTSLVSIDAKDFNDSSLGCPVAGMTYLQVITLPILRY